MTARPTPGAIPRAVRQVAATERPGSRHALARPWKTQHLGLGDCPVTGRVRRAVPTPIYDAVADSLDFDPARPDPLPDTTATLVEWRDNLLSTEDH